MTQDPDAARDNATNEQDITDEHERIRDAYEDGQEDSRLHAVVNLAAGSGAPVAGAPLIPHADADPPDGMTATEANQALNEAHGHDNTKG